jgi:hypothetical protein
MTRGDWLSQFEDELKKLRQHLSSVIAGMLAQQPRSIRDTVESPHTRA